MEHKYSRFRDKAIPYAKVGQRVFRSLASAEVYCTIHGLDVDTAIEYGNLPDLFFQIRQIAITQKTLLRDVLGCLDDYSVQLNEELSCAVQAREQAEKSRDPLLNYHKERVTEAIGKISGFYAARQIVWNILDDLECLIEQRG